MVSHWETGRRVPPPEDVASLLGAIGVTGDERERILHLARNASEPNWLTVGMPGIPEQLAGAVECERAAHAITEWSPMIIPGLVQISDYARVTISANETLSAADIESRVFVRLGRREILTRRNPIQLHALIGEAALRCPVGSAEVMADQLSYLLEVTQLPSITVRVIPAAAGWHPGLHGPFVLYDFPDAPPVLHFEHYSSGAFVPDEKDVAAYRAAIATLNHEAMSTEDSYDFIAKIAIEWSN